MRAACSDTLTILNLISLIIFGEKHKLWSSSFCSLLGLFYFCPFRSKYSPQPPLLITLNLCFSLKARERERERDTKFHIHTVEKKDKKKKKAAYVLKAVVRISIRCYI
jgi:dolichol kinase